VLKWFTGLKEDYHMAVLVQNIDPPPNVTIHMWGGDSPYHSYCGTFGYFMYQTDKSKEVNCERCKRKIQKEKKTAT
jgi:hypothetical protein